MFVLEFIQTGGINFDYKAGQFAIFKILKENFAGSPGKAYTIISLPGDDFLVIAVKKVGVFSGALCGLEIGDKVAIAGPYGNFYPSESDKKDTVFLAGGIGAMPFYAAIKNFYKKRINKRLFLFYSNRNEEDIIFKEELAEISGRWENLKIVNALTRSQNRCADIDEYGRINIEMIRKHLGDLGDKDYFICGPSSFVMDMKEQLKKAGVAADSIKIEAFY